MKPSFVITTVINSNFLNYVEQSQALENLLWIFIDLKMFQNFHLISIRLHSLVILEL